MINIDVTKDMNGEIGGDLSNLTIEFETIATYYYAMLISESPKNKDLFYDLIERAISEGEKIPKETFKKTYKEENDEKTQRLKN